MSLVDSTSSPRHKAIQITPRHLEARDHRIHPSRRLRAAQRGEQRVTSITTALGHHLDMTVREIPRPTGEPQFQCTGPGPEAEADPLYATAYERDQAYGSHDTAHHRLRESDRVGDVPMPPPEENWAHSHRCPE